MLSSSGRTAPLFATALSLWFAAHPLPASPCETSPATAAVGQGNPPATRAELWKARRLEKFGRIESKPTSGFERVMLRVEAGEFLDFNYNGFYPKFSSIGNGSGFAPGVRFWKPELGRSGLGLQSSAAYSFRNYQLYNLQFGRLPENPVLVAPPAGGELTNPFAEGPPDRSRRFFLYADAQYRYFPGEDFYGLGPDSLEANRTDFLLEDFSFDVDAGYRFNRWLGVAVRAGILNTRIGPGEDNRFPDLREVFDERQAPGILQTPDFSRFEARVFADYRDRPGNPHWGGIVSLSYSRHLQRDGDAFDFNRYTFDVRHYLPLGSVQRVLALSLFASAADADAGARVPFFVQNTLGGRNTLRGFRDFRFRDVNLLHFSAEYRWDPAPALELALFWDGGKAFPDRSRFDFQDLETSWGGGVRFKTSHSVFIRIDVAAGAEGTRVFLTVGPSF